MSHAYILNLTEAPDFGQKHVHSRILHESDHPTNKSLQLIKK